MQKHLTSRHRVCGTGCRVSDGAHRLAISPQCGFASVFEGNPITEEVGPMVWMNRTSADDWLQEERQKLALVVEAARQIWG